jgi:imidazolonepropionase
MLTTLLTNINELVTNTSPGTGQGTPIGELGILRNAAVVADKNQVLWVGPANEAPEADKVVDIAGDCLIPSFVDSHTHILFAGDRSAEFTSRMAGSSYTGGGIRSTVAATREASDEILRTSTRQLLSEARSQGTGVVEIKSGYGLTIESEKRLLRLAQEFTDETTYLGAHVVPDEYRTRPDDYVDIVASPMLDACAPYAKWADVFCEPHSPVAFTGEQSEHILAAARERGLGLRVHGAQLGFGPGPHLAAKYHAASIDHATFISDRDLSELADVARGPGEATVVTFLPIVEFSTRQPYPDARRVIDRGIPVAIASDCNPGTCYSNSIPLAIAFAVRDLHMTVHEAIWAATLGGARALRRPDLGRIAVGLPTYLTRIHAPHVEHLAYRPGVPLATTLSL